MKHIDRKQTSDWNAIRFLEERNAPRSLLSALRKSFGPRSQHVSNVIDGRCAMGICRNPDVAETIVHNTNWNVVRNPSSFFTSRFNAICSERVYCKCYKCILSTEDQQRSDSGSLNRDVSRRSTHHRSFSLEVREIANDGQRNHDTGFLEIDECRGVLCTTRQGNAPAQNGTAISCERETSSAPTKMSKKKRVNKKPLDQNHRLPGNNALFPLCSHGRLQKKHKISNRHQDSGEVAESTRCGTSKSLPLEFQSLSEDSVCLEPTRILRDLLPLLDEKPGMPTMTLRLFGRSIPIQY